MKLTMPPQSGGRKIAAPVSSDTNKPICAIICGTRNVTVSGCTIKVGDDGFAIRASCKLHAAEHPCENIRISNCDIWTCCWGIRFGVGTGTIHNVAVDNCRFHESANGIGFTSAWVAEGKNVYIEDIRVSNCKTLECGVAVVGFDELQ